MLHYIFNLLSLCVLVIEYVEWL